jgi:hypothetical protein
MSNLPVSSEYVLIFDFDGLLTNDDIWRPLTDGSRKFIEDHLPVNPECCLEISSKYTETYGHTVIAIADVFDINCSKEHHIAFMKSEPEPEQPKFSEHVKYNGPALFLSLHEFCINYEIDWYILTGADKEWVECYASLQGLSHIITEDKVIDYQEYADMKVPIYTKNPSLLSRLRDKSFITLRGGYDDHANMDADSMECCCGCLSLNIQKVS